MRVLHEDVISRIALLQEGIGKRAGRATTVPELTIQFLDVGQGDGIYIEFPSPIEGPPGATMLVTQQVASPDNAAASSLAQRMGACQRE
jgi:hypothetical protein